MNIFRKLWVCRHVWEFPKIIQLLVTQKERKIKNTQILQNYKHTQFQLSVTEIYLRVLYVNDHKKLQL